MKYYLKSTTVEAEQFYYVDGIDGPRTIARAKHLDLSRAGSSLLWETLTPEGWRVVNHGDWIVKDARGRQRVCSAKAFKEDYELAEGVLRL